MPTCSRGAFVLATGVTLVVLVAVPLASATEDPDPDFSLDNTVQAGPFHLAPFFIIKDLGYDSNVRLGAEEKTGDYTMTFGPGVRAIIPFSRRTTLALRDEIDYAVFARDSDLNHVNNQARAKLHVYLKEATLFADGQQDSFRDRPNNEVDYRIRNTITNGKFGLRYHPTDRGQIELYLGRIDYHYDTGSVDVTSDIDPNNDPGHLEDIAEGIENSLERDESGVGMAGRLRIRPHTSLLFEARTGTIDFESAVTELDPNTQAVLREFERDSNSHTLLGGFEFDPSGPIQGFIKMGYRHMSPDDDETDGYSGLIADIAVSARLFGRGDVRASYLRDTGFSTLGDNLYYNLTQKGLAYEHYINTRLSIEPGVLLQAIDYPVEFDPPQGFRQDDITTSQVTVRYRLGPSLRLGLTIARWVRESTFDNEDTSRNTLSTLVEYTP